MAEDPLKVELGNALRQLRKKYKVSGPELASRLGKQPAQIYRWERGEAAPGFDQVYRYLEALDACFFELDEWVEPGQRRRPGSARLKEIAAEIEALSRRIPRQ